MSGRPEPRRQDAPWEAFLPKPFSLEQLEALLDGLPSKPVRATPVPLSAAGHR
jgi:hypothetical protein